MSTYDAPLPTGVRGRLALSVLLATLVLAVGAAPALASWTGYDDLQVNTYAGPDPFGFGSPTGRQNVGTGQSVLASLTGGGFNVASGNAALLNTTDGSFNVATGQDAL